ncbi:hypothetical protein PYW08_008480 [Mythimna loreyi]|uniref:Uncharacterized protein n=1 Tax=Mythimna loreyi TaxID=667449 RepID=A0ACC2QBM0_9NEOP|nr:hypothetical protein PYW08_008480 [Mythimna loreyi]
MDPKKLYGITRTKINNHVMALPEDSDDENLSDDDEYQLPKLLDFKLYIADVLMRETTDVFTPTKRGRGRPLSEHNIQNIKKTIVTFVLTKTIIVLKVFMFLQMNKTFTIQPMFYYKSLFLF